MKYAVVTGANGFVGHYLVKLLSENNYYVYAIVRNKNEDIANIANIKNVDILFCDMAEIYKLEQLLHGKTIDYVYHLAWAGSSGELRTDYKLQMNNVLWTVQLIETIAKLNIKRLLIAGSVTQLMYREYLQEDDISPEMVTIYAISKINAEYLAKCLCTQYDIDLCWTYISNFYGADDTTNNFINFLIDNYLNNKVPTLTPAEQLSDFTYVTDISKGLMYACEKGKKNSSYYIGYGEPRPLKEFIIEVRDTVNPFIDTGIGLKDFNGKSIDFEKIDVKKLHRDTGFEPSISFKNGIKKCCQKSTNYK